MEEARRSPRVLPQGFEAVAGDLDGDGDLDVVATGWGPQGRLVWFENTGDPKRDWKQHLIKENWPKAVTVILADLDEDGRLDIVACAERGANELRWWRNEERPEVIGVIPSEPYSRWAGGSPALRLHAGEPPAERRGHRNLTAYSLHGPAPPIEEDRISADSSSDP